MFKLNTIRKKLALRFGILFIVLYFLLLLLVYFSISSLIINSAKNNSKVISKNIKDTITSMMVLDVIKLRHVFLENLMDTDSLGNVDKIKIIRGQNVINQFGEGKDFEKPTTSLEKESLKSGKMLEISGNFITNPTYRLVMPYRSNSQGNIICSRCHNVKENEVLGAVSVTFNLKEERSRLIKFLSIAAVVLFLFLLLSFYIIYTFTKPYTNFFNQLLNGFDKIVKGQFDYDGEIKTQLKDEAGNVAEKFNLMINKLQDSFSEISNRVFTLVGLNTSETGDTIKDTLSSVDHLIKIYNFKKVIEQISDRESIFKQIQNILFELDINQFSIYEVNFRKNTFELVASNDFIQKNDSINIKGFVDEEAININSLRCDQPILEELNLCPAKQNATIIDSISSGDICPVYKTAKLHNLNFKCIPILGQGIGVILQLFYTSDNIPLFHNKTVYIERFINEALNILEINSAMEFIKEQSLTDELTQLYNRRYLENISSKLLDLTKRNRSILGFIMLDIDFFKRVNDNYGHDAGDLILKKVADIIKRSVRESDIVIRFGGEEVLILAMNIKKDRIFDLAEKIRKNVESTEIEFEEFKLTQTVSLGCSEYPNNSSNFWTCVKFADTAMYKAKDSGRNKVVCYQDLVK